MKTKAEKKLFNKILQRKETKEGIIMIEGYNIKKLSKEAIDFYFSCSVQERNILCEFLNIQEKEFLELIKKINYDKNNIAIIEFKKLLVKAVEGRK